MKWAAAIWHSNPDKQNSLNSLGENHINYTVSYIYLAQSWTIPRLKRVLSVSGAMPLRLRMCPGHWDGLRTQHTEVHPWAEQGCRNAEEQSLQYTIATKSDRVQQSSFCKLGLTKQKKKGKKRKNLLERRDFPNFCNVRHWLHSCAMRTV